jgi:hypothetical protein
MPGALALARRLAEPATLDRLRTMTLAAALGEVWPELARH